MDIFAFFTMIGGLALFLYGMNAMGDGLARLSGGRLERILEKLTSNRLKALFLGAFVTAVIQSSSATTVMVVGFVNSGIMQLTKAVGIIMGANIGTTITSWLLSLSGLSGDTIWIKLLKPSSFSPVLAGIGMVLIMLPSKATKKKEVGNILVAFAILMFGMETMSGAVAPLAQNEKFTGILTMFSQPILGLIAGAVLTAVIQSSSASVGILQALCISGAVSYSTAIPIIMGQNIGTCVTALISSVGANKNAKRASMIHLYFNMIGTVLFMVVFYSINMVISFAFLQDSASAFGIAVIHSLFNIGCAIVLFPFGNGLVKLAKLTIKDKDEVIEKQEGELPQELAALDERFLSTPSFAIQVSLDAVKKMALETKQSIYLATELLSDYDEDKRNEVVRLEGLVDRYEDELGSYLVKISGQNLSKEDSRSLSVMLHCVSDIERISDHAINLSGFAVELNEKKETFSGEAKEELDIYCKAVRDIVDRAVTVLMNNDLEQAKHIEPLEEVIDGLQMKMRTNHIQRLRKGSCTIEMGIILEDILTNLERVSDHCSNIGVALIQISEDGFDTHEYVDMRLKKSPWFEKEVVQLSNLYKFTRQKEQE